MNTINKFTYFFSFLLHYSFMFNKVTYYFSFLVSQSLCTYFALMDKSYGINFMKMIAVQPITKSSEFLASHTDMRKIYR